MALEVMSGAAYHDAAKVSGKTNVDVNTVPDLAANINVTEVAAAAKISGGNPAGNEQNNGQKESSASEKQIKDAIFKANNKLKISRTRCEFSYDEETKRVSIKVFDEDTKEIIKEIPPEETLRMIEKMWELAGILVDERR
jgi:flagellar protein FlaG